MSRGFAVRQCLVLIHAWAGGLLPQRVKEGSKDETLMLLNLALNANVMPVPSQSAAAEGGFLYKSSSPDEVALVQAAARMGVRLVRRDDALTLHVNGREV